jgi:TM2 domain-containing membrane protein YozV
MLAFGAAGLSIWRTVVWIFGFTGSHRFYYGKPVSGTIWFFTAGLLLIGWILIYDFWTLNSQISELNVSKQVK